MDSKINLDYYKIFYFTARQDSFSSAAQILGVSQPAVTRSIKNLEAELSCPLFARSAKGISLTKEGQILYEELIPAFSHIDAAKESIRKLQALEAGALRIGVDSLISSSMITDSLTAFRKFYPGIQVFQSKLYVPEIFQYLDEGMIDFAVLCTIKKPFQGHELYAVLREDTRFCRQKLAVLTDDFVVGPKYEYLHDRFVDIEQLAGLPFIYPTIEVQNSGYYTSIFAKLHQDRSRDLPISGASSRISLTRFNHGFTYFPSRFLEKDYQEKKLFPVFTNIRMREYDLQILYKSGISLTPSCQKYLEVLTESFRKAE